MTTEEQNEIMAQFLDNILSETIELDADIQEAVDENFWDLL